MSAKGVRNAIIGLVILIIAMQLIVNISQGFFAQVEEAEIPVDIINFSSVRSIVNAFTYGVIFLILILIPFYLSARKKPSKEESNL